MIEIKHRETGALLRAIDLPSVSGAAALQGAYLRTADLRGADLRRADLRNADLRNANLAGADLRHANLSHADLWDADLSNADLGSANLRDANLKRANLEGADLRNADLTHATVGGVLRGANLAGARLETGETFEEYLAETMPAFLTAGGKTLADAAAAWEYHSWDSCPTAVAFSCHHLSGVPQLLRPRAEQFIRLFDDDLLPKPAIPKEP